MRRVLITGSSQGIGLALASAFLDCGDKVIATARDPDEIRTSLGTHDRLTCLPLDVTSQLSVQKARSLYDSDSLDILVNNAGINGRSQHAPGVNFAQIEAVLEVNSIGPVRMYDAFIDLIRASKGLRIVVNLSSEAGSLSSFRASSKPDYAMSKAALNAFTRWIAVQEKEVICVAIDPGWTRTRMGGASAPHAPEETARRLLDAINGLEPKHSGRFLDTALNDVGW